MMEKLLFTFFLIFATASTQLLDNPDVDGGLLRSRGPRPPLLSASRRADTVGPANKEPSFDDYYDYNPGPAEDQPQQLPRRPAPPSRPNSLLNPYGNGDCRQKTKTVPHEKYCDLYYHTTGCDDSQSLLRSCPNGLLYTGSGRHGLIGVCDYPHNVNCGQKKKHISAQKVIEQQDPCQVKSKVVGDVTYCDRYWECFQGIPELYDCPNGLVWVGKNRGIADGCDYPWRNPSLCQNKDLANPPLSTEHCDWLYGIFGHETSCTRYWTCWNGTATEQFCVGGLLYNEETHACDWPQNVGGCQKHPLCKDDANGNVPLGKSCNRYWACQGGYPRLQRCPAMLVFDKLRKRCVSPPTEDCDVPPTTSPPETDNNENNKRQKQQKAAQQQEHRRRLAQQLLNDQQGGGLGGGGGDDLRGQPQPPFQLPGGATLLRRPQQN